MKIHTSISVAALLLVPSIIALAGEPSTIPLETYKVMKKGKKLNRVWQAPGFDGSQGFQLGKVSNESEDDASTVMQDIPVVLRRLTRDGSPYTLHLAVIGVRSIPQAGSTFSSWVDVEGRVLDPGGKLVAALETRGNATIGGNKRDNLRFALNDIAFGLAKDLFSAGLPSNAKAPAVIVASPGNAAAAPAPVPSAKPSAVIVPAPAPVPPEKPSAAPAVVTPPSAASIEPAAIPQPPPAAAAPAPAAPVPLPPPATAPVPPPSPAAAPVPAPKSPISEALPPSIAENMKRGSALDRLWISPAYDRASGFSIGEVRYLTDQRDDIVSAYLPDGLAEIASKDAPCALHLGITGLTNRAVIGRSAPIRIKIEGRLIAKDGTILAAFTSADSVQSTDDRNANYRELGRKVVVAIGKDLR